MEIGGHKINNWVVVGGVAGAGIVGYILLKNRGAASAATSTSSSDQNSIDPVTGLPYSEDNEVDSTTGMTYLAEAQEYGSVQAADEEVTSGEAYYGDTGVGDELDSGYPTGYTYPSDLGTGSSYDSNASWAQAATAGLTDLGYSSEDISAALGLYFQDQPLGTAPDGASYLSIVQAAVAEYGPPPVGSFSIVGAPSTSTTTSTGGSVTVPNCAGQTTGEAHNLIVAAGLVPTDPNGSVSGESSWKCTGTSPAAGTSVASGSSVEILSSKPAATTSKPTSAPSGLTIAYPSADVIKATWHAVSGATSYNFGISPAPKNGVAGAHNIGNRTDYNVDGIVKGTTYTVTVSAENSAGDGPSATHSFKAT